MARIGIFCLFALLAPGGGIAQEANRNGFVSVGFGNVGEDDGAPRIVRVLPVPERMVDQLMTGKPVAPDEIPKSLTGELRHAAAFFENQQVRFPGHDCGWFHPGMEVVIVYTTPAQAEVIAMILAREGTGQEKRISTHCRIYATGAGGKGVARESKWTTETRPGQKMRFAVEESGLLRGGASLASHLSGTRRLLNEVDTAVSYKGSNYKLACSTRTALKNPLDYLLGVTSEGEEIHLEIRQEIVPRRATEKISATKIVELEKALAMELASTANGERKEMKDAHAP